MSYGSTRRGDPFALYVMTHRHLLKARNIASDPRVSVVIPVPRPALTFLPPATIQMHGRAELPNWDNAQGTGVFEKFWMGRRILQGYRRARENGETRVCFVKIIPDPKVHTYMVGSNIWQLRRNTTAARHRWFGLVHSIEPASDVGDAVAEFPPHWMPEGPLPSARRS